MGSIPGWGNKIIRALEQLSSRITTTELMSSTRELVQHNKRPHMTQQRSRAPTETRRNQINSKYSRKN